MQKLNVAVIGYGGMGEYHINTLIDKTLFNVTGIFDIDPNRIKKATEDGVFCYKNLEEIANDTKIDIVLIATPNDSHVFYSNYFAEKGKKNILCEKPVTMKSSDFKKMVATADKNKVSLTVHQCRRWDEDYLTIKAIFDSHKIDGIYHIVSNVTGCNGIPGDWRKQKEKGGGMMYDWGVHLIDQILQLKKCKIKDIYCRYLYSTGYEVDDGFRLFLTFEDNTTAEINVDTNSYIPLPRWYVYGLNGTAIIKNWNIEGEIVLAQRCENQNIKGIKAGSGFTKTMANTNEKQIIELPAYTPLEKTFYKNLYDVITCGSENYIKNEEVYRVLKIMEYAKKSAFSDKVIKLRS